MRQADPEHALAFVEAQVSDHLQCIIVARPNVDALLTQSAGQRCAAVKRMSHRHRWYAFVQAVGVGDALYLQLWDPAQAFDQFLRQRHLIGRDSGVGASQLGAAIARDLTADINAMGMYAVQAGPGSQPEVGDAVIRGYIVSAESGSMGKRFVLGFGSGASQLETVVEGYAVTKHGWRKVGSGTLNAQGNKTPGLVVPGAIAIATGNPIGLAVMGGVKIYGQVSGRNTLN